MEESQRVQVFFSQSARDGLKLYEPGLFLDQGQQLLEQPTQFLREHFVRSGRRRSPNTWSAAAYSLASWFDFLIALERRDWATACRDDLINYRDAFLLATNSSTGRRYEPSTIAHRLTFVVDFYRYAATQGWYAGELALDQDEILSGKKSTSKGRFVFASGRSAAADLFPKRSLSARPVCPVTPTEMHALLQAVGPRASEARGAAGRDRLILDFGWATGLRVSEVARLSVTSFASMSIDPAWPSGDQRLQVVGKGGYRRVIALPNWLATDVVHYIENERRDAIGAARGRAKHETALLVSSAHSSQPGQSICVRRLQQVLDRACFVSGLTDERPGEVKPVRARYTFHQLRHTYAVFTYIAEVELGNPEPWKKIQTQLGHRFLSTTIDTYLRYAATFLRGGQKFDIRSIVGI